MARVEGIGIRKSTKKHIPLCGNHYEVAPQINKILPRDKVYYLSLDQSCNYSGIYLTDSNFEWNLIFDFEREFVDALDYEREMQFFVSKLIRDLNVKLCVIEKPITPGFGNGNPHLARLMKQIKSWTNEILELENLEIQTISPNVWRSRILDKSKGKYRGRSKEKIVEDILDVVPWIEPFKAICKSKDYDGFEAVGILHGYLRLHEIEDSKDLENPDDAVKTIYSESPYLGRCVVCLKYVYTSSLKNMHTLVEGINTREPVKLARLNPDYSFALNVRMACVNEEPRLVIIDSNQLHLNMLWETGYTPADNHVFIAIFARATQFTKTNLNFAREFSHIILLT